MIIIVGLCRFVLVHVSHTTLCGCTTPPHTACNTTPTAPISTAASAHLDRIQPELAGTPGGDPRQGPAYRLRAVGHSLGGAMLLMYAVHRRMEGKPHHLSRLVLLTPAGMLREYPKVCMGACICVFGCVCFVGCVC